MNIRRSEARQYVGGEDSQVALWVTEFEKRHPKASLDEILFNKNIVVITYSEAVPD